MPSENVLPPEPAATAQPERRARAMRNSSSYSEGSPDYRTPGLHILDGSEAMNRAILEAAVDAITRSLAKELGPRGIRVNSINPGMVETEGVHAAGLSEGDFRNMVESQTPLGRIGQPRDIAPAVAFLASADSGWITGETLDIAGGFR